MKEKPTVGFQFFWAFPSDRIPKAKKDVNVHLFINSGNCCTLYISQFLYIVLANYGNFLELLRSVQ